MIVQFIALFAQRSYWAFKKLCRFVFAHMKRTPAAIEENQRLMLATLAATLIVAAFPVTEIARSAFVSEEGAVHDGSTPVSTGAVSIDAVFQVFELRYEAKAAEAVQVANENAARTWPRDALVKLAEDVALEEGIDPSLFHALIEAESNFDIAAVSSKCAMSLAQLMPATALELGLTPLEFFDPEANLRGGARYLRALLDELEDPGLALAAYNAGAARIKNRAPSRWPAETRDYVRKVLHRSGTYSPGFTGASPQIQRIAALSGSITSMRASLLSKPDEKEKAGGDDVSADTIVKNETDPSKAQLMMDGDGPEFEAAVRAFIAGTAKNSADSASATSSGQHESLKSQYMRQKKGAGL